MDTVSCVYFIYVCIDVCNIYMYVIIIGTEEEVMTLRGNGGYRGWKAEGWK